MKALPAIATLSLVLLGASSVLAVENDANVDAVLEKYVKAIGGKEAWDKVESRRTRADVEIFGQTAEWTLEAKAPNRRAARVDLPGVGLIEDVFDGKAAWSKSPNGVQEKQGDELARAKIEAELRREVRLKELYPGLESRAAESFNGEEVQVLEAKPSATSKERFSFSTKTGLLVRQQADFENRDGNQLTVETEFSDYRDVDGIKYPHVLKFVILSGGQQVFDFGIKVKEIKHNEKIDDAKFAKPAE